MKLLKYLKCIGIYIGGILLISLLLSLLQLIGLESNLISILMIILVGVLSLMTGLVHGKKTTKKGYFEGLKIGVLSILILYIINFIFYNPNYNLKLLTYYSIIALFNVLGGMIGKAQKKETINK